MVLLAFRTAFSGYKEWQTTKRKKEIQPLWREAQRFLSDKPKKSINPQTLDKVKTGFMTLISNNAVVKAGRNYTWIVPLILCIVSDSVTLKNENSGKYETIEGTEVKKYSYNHHTTDRLETIKKPADWKR